MTLIVPDGDVFTRHVPTQHTESTLRWKILMQVPHTRHCFTEMRAGDTVNSKTSVQTHRTLLSKPLRSVAVKKWSFDQNVFETPSSDLPWIQSAIAEPVRPGRSAPTL